MSDKVVPGQLEGVDLQSLFDSLRHVCDQLEHEKMSLEDSIRLYALAKSLEMRIKSELGRAERRLVEIVSEDGTIRPFDVDIESPRRGVKDT